MQPANDVEPPAPPTLEEAIAQRDRAEEQHNLLLVSLVKIARALGVPPNEKACIERIKLLYQSRE